MGINLDEFIAENMAAKPVEAKIVKAVWEAAEAAGDPITRAFDGDDWYAIGSLEDLNRCVFNLDEVALYTRTDGYILLVCGNEWDMLSDYYVRLEDMLAPVNAKIDRMAL